MITRQNNFIEIKDEDGDIAVIGNQVFNIPTMIVNPPAGKVRIYSLLTEEDYELPEPEPLEEWVGEEEIIEEDPNDPE
jgi:hypothetical protein